MDTSLPDALAQVRTRLLDRDGLRRAIAAGRRRGATPSAVRVELRPVEIGAGPRLQVVTSDGVRPSTRNVEWSTVESIVDELLAEPYGNWHVETATETIQLRVTKKGTAQLHLLPVDLGVVAPHSGRTGGETPRSTREGGTGTATATAHDRQAAHLLDPGDPLFDVIGGGAAKRRQVDAFLRALASTLDDKMPSPIHIVDLGCGNAYLTFAAYQLLTRWGVDVRVSGVDVREDQRERNAGLAAKLGIDDKVRFVAGTIADASVHGADVVLALHACDTATDEALARAIGWRARYVLAAPCCHHDISAQLRLSKAGGALTRHGILRERFADVLTDALRAAQLRLRGYQVDVVEFVDSAHTPRNVLIRARYTGAAPTPEQGAEFEALKSEWGVTPALDVGHLGAT